MRFYKVFIDHDFQNWNRAIVTVDGQRFKCDDPEEAPFVELGMGEVSEYLNGRLWRMAERPLPTTHPVYDTGKPTTDARYDSDGKLVSIDGEKVDPVISQDEWEKAGRFFPKP